MLSYYQQIKTSSGLTFSIDNVVIDFYIGNTTVRDRLASLIANLPIKYAVEVVHWNSFRMGTFHDQFTITFQDKNSFWLGVALNLSKTEWGKLRLDFNPNKVAAHEVFQLVLSFLVMNTPPMHRIIKRFDLAIDIPVPRHLCTLEKDNRAYIERRHGKEFTQYLGAKSSTEGRVKLYNKQVEAKLEYPLTRYEVTLNPSKPYIEQPFATVYYIKTQQMKMDELKVTDTERFILNANLQGFGNLNQLGRRTRDKIKLLMDSYVEYINVSERDYNLIISILR